MSQTCTVQSLQHRQRLRKQSTSGKRVETTLAPPVFGAGSVYLHIHFGRARMLTQARVDRV
jgi:hypothetical protein